MQDTRTQKSGKSGDLPDFCFLCDSSGQSPASDKSLSSRVVFFAEYFTRDKKAGLMY